MNTIVTTPTQKKRSAQIGMALALLAALFFSIKAIFVKLAYQHGVDAITLLTLRMAFALPVFIAVAIIEQRKAGGQQITRRQSMSIIGLGLMGYYLASMLDFIGLQYISASMERLILFLFPTFTVLLSMLFLGRRVRLIEIGALALSYIGIALAVQQEVSLGGENSLLQSMHTDWPLPCSLRYLLPAFMLAAAIHRIGASHTAIIGGIGPVATIVLAVLFLGESMSCLQIGGALLVIVGVLLLGIFRNR